MKSELVEVIKVMPPYEPMVIQFTLETPEDARLMYHLCNCDDLKKVLVGAGDLYRFKKFSDSLNSSLGEIIIEHLDLFGYEI